MTSKLVDEARVIQPNLLLWTRLSIFQSSSSSSSSLSSPFATNYSYTKPPPLLGLFFFVRLFISVAAIVRHLSLSLYFQNSPKNINAVINRWMSPCTHALLSSPLYYFVSFFWFSDLFLIASGFEWSVCIWTDWTTAIGHGLQRHHHRGHVSGSASTWRLSNLFLTSSIHLAMDRVCTLCVCVCIDRILM